MALPDCKITILPAKEGDSVFLEFSYDNSYFTMLIDTGPTSCWKNSLRPLMDDLIARDQRINVLLLTHIDSDHIGGAIRLLQSKNYNSHIDEVWFNGAFQILTSTNNDPNMRDCRAYSKINSEHIHIPDDCDNLISSRQGITISEALREHKIPVNAFNNGNAITCFTPSYYINSNFYIDFLLPEPKRLDDIKILFENELNRAVRGAISSNVSECDTAFENFLLDQKPYSALTEDISNQNFSANLDSIKNLCQISVSDDKSVTNASSIAVCIYFYGKTMLFPGDANSCDLTKHLGEWINHRNGTKIFDIVKLPHHGAVSNCCGIIEQLQAKVFIASTDGKKFRHPSRETIAKLINNDHCHGTTLIFNYPNDTFNFYNNPSLKEKYNYEIFVQRESLVIEGDYK